jgi:ubiquinone/menaquinone biosynthesis C-methylase UbiE
MSIAIGTDSESVGATYDAAADHFDEGPLSFRDRFGRGTIARLDLPVGASVLDVGCGTGTTAILAAELVGREGRVIGVDLSARMVMRARAKAGARGVHHANFLVADMGELAFPDEGFDAVISAFSIFFAPDMAAQVRKLWRLVRPGGQLPSPPGGRVLRLIGLRHPYATSGGSSRLPPATAPASRGLRPSNGPSGNTTSTLTSVRSSRFLEFPRVALKRRQELVL